MCNVSGFVATARTLGCSLQLWVYSAGGLFRYVYNGCRNDLEFDATATDEEKAKRQTDRADRWKKGLEMFMSIDDM